jgi:aspartate/methionine/tyrosine aminotransferase
MLGANMEFSTSRRAAHIPVSGTVAIADRAAALRREGVDVVDLSAARAPEATPQPILAAALVALEKGDTHQTPARGTQAFRQAVSDKLRRENGLEVDPDEQVLATLGVKEGLLLALQAGIEPGDIVLVEDPCFVSHGPLVQMAGGVPVPMRLEAERHHALPAHAEDLFARARAIIVCNPHNPTGVVRSREELERLAGLAAEHDILVISDEVYERVVWGGREHSCLASTPLAADRTVTLMSTTKAYAMGGWRIGWAAGPSSLIEAMTRLHAHQVTCAPSFAQTATTAALSAAVTPTLRDLWAVWERRCTDFATQLAKLTGIRCEIPEAGFFVWANVRDVDPDDEAVANRLLEEQHTVVIPGSAFGEGGRGFLRINAVKDDATLARGLERIGRVLG